MKRFGRVYRIVDSEGRQITTRLWSKEEHAEISRASRGKPGTRVVGGTVEWDREEE